MVTRATKSSKSAGGRTSGNGAKNPGVAGAEGNVEQIRDILFGTQMRDYESKFSKLESRLAKDISSIRNEINKRLDSLEVYLDDELLSIRDNMKQEKQERSTALREVAQDLKNTQKALEKKISTVETQLDKSIAQLRKQLLEQNKSLTDEIISKHIETTESLDAIAQELRYDKLNRNTMAELLSEIALRISDDPADGGKVEGKGRK